MTNTTAAANDERSKEIDFPLGWYTRIDKAETLAQVSKEGIGMNLLIPYSQGKDFPTIRTYLDRAEAVGANVFVQLYPGPVKTQNLNAVRKFVRAFKQHPAVSGWYVYDEPVEHGVSIEAFKAVCNTIRAEDPERPLAAVFPGQFWKTKNYSSVLDIYMVDYYPVKYGQPEFSNLDRFGKWMQAGAFYAKNNEFWPVLQAFGRHDQDLNPNNQWRFPTLLEERYMLYRAILAGADGLVFYAHHRTLSSWVDTVLVPLLKEFRDYVPAIKAGPVSKKMKLDKNVQGVLYQYPDSGDYLLIAAHDGENTVNATVNLNDVVAANSIEVLGERRSLNVTNTKFNDSFGPYEVHIYTVR